MRISDWSSDVCSSDLPLRAHMRQGMALPSPDEAVDAYETAVARADERGDARYAAADESSRLTVVGQRRTRLLLAADQADARAQAASARRESALTAWARELAEAGVPALAPTRFLGWVSVMEKVGSASCRGRCVQNRESSGV